jgi:hypothetical protein
MEVKPKIYKVENLTISNIAAMIQLNPNDLKQIASAKGLNIYKYKGGFYIIDGNVVFVCYEELFESKRKQNVIQSSS